MKLAPKDVARFTASPPTGLRAVLCYGPDGGQAREAVASMLKALGIEKSDPFAYTELSAAQVADEPSRLYEALQSVSLTGQSPCIALEDASDKLTDTLKDALDTTPPGNLLLMVGGDLPKKSSLRAFMEDAKRKELVAIACYRDEGASLAQYIRAFLQERGITPERGAVETLASLLGNDRGVTQRELEKLDLYLGEQRHLSEAEALALLGDNRHLLLGDAALAWLSGDTAAFLRLSEPLFRAGESPIALVRMLMNGAGRLMTLHQHVAGGMSADQAMMRVSPPVFFKDKPLYQKALRRLNPAALLRLLGHLQALEVALKRTQTPELLLLHQLGFTLSNKR